VALIARYLIDTSAAARMRHTEVSRRLRPLIEGGVVVTTASLDAEALYSARGPAEYEQLWADRRAAYEYLPTNDEHWQTAPTCSEHWQERVNIESSAWRTC
jgi:predicted nucleic acid-binding protein